MKFNVSLVLPLVKNIIYPDFGTPPYKRACPFFIFSRLFILFLLSDRIHDPQTSIQRGLATPPGDGHYVTLQSMSSAQKCLFLARTVLFEGADRNFWDIIIDTMRHLTSSFDVISCLSSSKACLFLCWNLARGSTHPRRPYAFQDSPLLMIESVLVEQSVPGEDT